MLLSLVAPALASAYYFLDSGTRAIGRGGAFVAGADDMSAQYYNPAALSHIDRPMVNLNTWVVSQYVMFDRADEEGLEAFEPVYNESEPIIEPSGGFATPLGGIHPILKGTTLAIGLYVPTSPYMAFPKDGPQRYSLIDSLIWQIYAGPSVAQEITPWLTVGAGLQYTFLRVEESLAAIICADEDQCTEGSDDPSDDLTLDIKAWDKNQWSGNAGILVTPAPWIEIGASVQPPISYEAPGSLSSTFDPEGSLTQFLDSTEITDEDITLLVTVPLIVRAGVQVKPADGVNVEAAGTWANWSSLEALTITDVDMSVSYTIPGQEPTTTTVTDDIVFATGYQDSFSVRLGGDWQALPWLKPSAGVHYESSAVPKETQGVNLVDGPKWGFGVGSRFNLGKRVALDASFAKQFIQSREITDSKYRQQALLANIATGESVVTYGKVVGNGEFASNLTFAAIGATVYFGGTPTP